MKHERLPFATKSVKNNKNPNKWTLRKNNVKKSITDFDEIWYNCRIQYWFLEDGLLGYIT